MDKEIKKYFFNDKPEGGDFIEMMQQEGITRITDRVTSKFVDNYCKESYISNNIPYLIHNIYLKINNDSLSISDYDINIIRNNIGKFTELSAKVEYNLWTNNPEFFENHHFASEGIFIKNIYTLPLSSLLEEAKRCISKNQKDFLPACSDIVRGLILKEYGGIYLDIDYAIYDNILLSCLLRDYNFIVGQYHNIGHINNAFIAATKNHPIINEYIEILERNLNNVDKLIDYDEPIAINNFVPNYVKYPGNFYTKLIMVMGPGALTVATYKKQNINTDLILDVGLVYAPKPQNLEDDNKGIIGNDAFKGTWIKNITYDYFSLHDEL